MNIEVVCLGFFFFFLPPSCIFCNKVKNLPWSVIPKYLPEPNLDPALLSLHRTWRQQLGVIGSCCCSSNPVRRGQVHSYTIFSSRNSNAQYSKNTFALSTMHSLRSPLRGERISKTSEVCRCHTVILRIQKIA